MAPLVLTRPRLEGGRALLPDQSFIGIPKGKKASRQTNTTDKNKAYDAFKEPIRNETKMKVCERFIKVFI